MKQPCPYCGNNPVPHFLNWYFESINVLFAPLRMVLLYNPASEFALKIVGRLRIGLLAARLLAFFKILTFNNNRALCKVSRAEVLWEEAEKRGIAMSELKLFGRPFDTYMVSWKIQDPGSKTENTQSMVFSGLPRPAGHDRKALDSMDDKFLLKRKLLAAGLPVPLGEAVTTMFGARRVFARIAKNKIRSASGYDGTGKVPAIVKPRAGSRGRHSTTFVVSETDLKNAFRVAKQLCHWVIVEQQLMGPVYRATVVGFKLEGVLRGDPPRVAGDGKHTVFELIEMKNNKPHPGVKEIVKDESMELLLKRELSGKVQKQNIADQSGQIPKGGIFGYIPAAGEDVILSEKIGVSYGGSSSEDFEICHVDNRRLFEQAAKAVGDPIVGFDFIIQDITRSWKEQDCGFIEANSLPFINLHHHPLHGQPRNVAAAVWDLAGIRG